MSKAFVYGVLCEDKAHKNFIEHYLAIAHPGTFQESQPFGWTIKASNNREVEDALPDATRQGFIKFGLDILFVGRDADTTKEKEIDDLKNKLTSLCHSHPKVILMVPVQCIEHWLLYLQWRRDHPTSTKNESLDHIMRSEAKIKVYGGKLKVDRQLEKANELLVTLDIQWLESRSDSFKHFHSQVESFLSKHN